MIRLNDPEISGRIYYEVASHCNLKCEHCSDLFHAGRNLVDVDAVLRFHGELSGGSRLDCVVTGGEPTLHKQFDRLACGLAEFGVVVVTTNGSLLPPESAARLLERHSNLYFQISLDGATRETFEAIRGVGTYDVVFGFLRELCNLGFGAQVGISMTPMRSNISEIQEMIELAVSLGIGSLHFPSLVPVGVALKNWNALSIPYSDQIRVDELLVNAIQRYAGVLSISVNAFGQALSRSMSDGAADCLNLYTLKVDASGNILPCPTTSNRKLSLGNITEPGIARGLLDRLRGRHEEFQSLKGPVLSGCGGCRHWSGCRSRFCENCGLLGPPDPDVVQNACSVVSYRFDEIRRAVDAVEPVATL